MRQATQRLEGVKGLSADTGDQQPSTVSQQAKKGPAKRRGAGTDDVGRALRSAYDETLREEVPDDFLDLLGKLS